MTQIYKLPEFLNGRVDRQKYIKWLSKKATAHAKRDRARLGIAITIASYKQAIHKAAEESLGNDWYTGEALEWEKIKTYNNDDSKENRSIYKASLALLPKVDHVLDDTGAYTFVICAWRTNDAKSDLSLFDFLFLCRRVLDKHGGMIDT